ncbi:MAG TPA: TM2 domain-containing protein [Aurantimonas coralicida]|uniref:TM2 domain-containing protein n=2 Tax=root TaxID=1 RepID=A0A9C9NJF9_9HYPH|nr:TM2 domain-containing protein [Aurantimonas coralicida]HEU02609.1 TM2 domain-containing protein [Aurantimonas coralicida]
MSLDGQERMIIETRVASESPSTGVAYLLWFFLWFISAHRFYLGRPGTAILQIISYFILVGFIWLIVDAFLIPGMIQKKRDEIRQKLTIEALAAYRGPQEIRRQVGRDDRRSEPEFDRIPD